MDTSSKSLCAQLVQDVADHFWQRWAAEVTPIHVIRQRWHAMQRNLKVGDIVLVHDSNKLQKKYKLAVVTDVHTSQDGMVRSCTVGYRQARAPTKKEKYRSVWQVLQRSVQRLTLLLPVEEQDERIEVTDGVVTRAQLSNIDCVQPTNVTCILPDETERDICPEQQDDDEDLGFDSETIIESILSPTAEPFCPRIACKTRNACET